MANTSTSHPPLDFALFTSLQTGSILQPLFLSTKIFYAYRESPVTKPVHWPPSAVVIKWCWDRDIILGLDTHSSGIGHKYSPQIRPIYNHWMWHTHGPTWEYRYSWKRHKYNPYEGNNQVLRFVNLQPLECELNLPQLFHEPPWPSHCSPDLYNWKWLGPSLKRFMWA